MTSQITECDSNNDGEILQICERLEALSQSSMDNPDWPAAQLKLLEQSKVYRWFIPRHLGGLQWEPAQIASAYVKLASVCLTTTFILTQRVAALRRICASDNVALRNTLLSGILEGNTQATVGISHLTTSRRHLAQPACLAIEKDSGYSVTGQSPWVTGACEATHLVVGAEMPDGRQILFAIATDAPGITVSHGLDLVALTASQTGPVKFENVFVDPAWLLTDPTEQVLAASGLISTGSTQTSALALGLATSAVNFIEQESLQRPDLFETAEALKKQQSELEDRLLKLSSGIAICTNEELRTEMNSFVLRTTQASMAAAKGAGFVQRHPAGRWCREALFFLVWSCPHSVIHANLCELAGIE
ncbi:MAG: acyl-CoA dehydrogenase family protein [Pirellulales bacterium]